MFSRLGSSSARRVARFDTGIAWAEELPVAHPSPHGQSRGGTAGERRGRGQDSVPDVPSHLETDHQLLSGCREDVLRKANGAWKAARRTIVLDANVLLDENLSVFL
ncbi:MAG TPA: hypothetical protein VNZ53_33815 [Steroidobacteraceae bacterium]|jgi:ethylbenzene dioxygenase beta subunit|nr:hypothetical protein [Steroidobacteraceae bacterium]